MKKLTDNQIMHKAIRAVFNLRDVEFRQLVESGNLTKAHLVQNIPGLDFPFSLAQMLKCWGIILADVSEEFFRKDLKQVGAVRFQNIASTVISELHLNLLEVEIDFPAIQGLYCYDKELFDEESAFDTYEDDDYLNIVNNTRSIDRDLFVAKCFLDFEQAYELVRNGANPYAYMHYCPLDELAHYQELMENRSDNEYNPRNCFSETMFEDDLWEDYSATIFGETDHWNIDDTLCIISLAAHREMVHLLDFAAFKAYDKTAPHLAKSYRRALRTLLRRVMLMVPAPCFTKEHIDDVVSHYSDEEIMEYVNSGASPEDLSDMITL